MHLKSSLCRSLLKNLSLGLLFPLCIVQFAFPFNRAVYDILTKTVVVEVNW